MSGKQLRYSTDIHRCPVCGVDGLLHHTGYRMVGDYYEDTGIENWRWNEKWQCDNSCHGFEIKAQRSHEITYTDQEFLVFITEGRHIGNTYIEQGYGDNDSYFVDLDMDKQS